MGFLDKLRGGGDITLSVDVDPLELGPGGEVTVRFDLGGELDDKCRGLRVALEGVANYKVKVRERDHDGDMTTTEEWRSYELHKEEHHYPAEVGPGQATFSVPPDKPPSSTGAVTWSVSACGPTERLHGERGRFRAGIAPHEAAQAVTKHARRPRTADPAGP